MEPIAGVYRNLENARAAMLQLKRAGYSPDDLNLLYPGSPEEKIHSIPISETEQPGLGKAIGGVVGAALGFAGGAELGAAGAIASGAIPGVGPVVAMGIAVAALLGAGGAALGSAAERKSTGGLPADEIFFYEDAIRRGRSLVIVMANGKGEAERARELMADAGAESIDAAREAWWIGLRDAEGEHYRALGHNFEQDHEAYREGFEAALRRDCHGKSYPKVAQRLLRDHPQHGDSEAFRRGFERGQEYSPAQCGTAAE